MVNGKTAKKTDTAQGKTPAKKAKVSLLQKNKGNTKLYSNLAYKRRVKKDERARKEAEERAKLPKNPVLRFFAKLRPDRVFKAIFSLKGLKFFLKFCAFCFLMGVIAVGGLFLYFKKDLSAINPEELANRVTNTVNTYLDRNGEVLWEDKGDGDYRLVVESEDISTYMRQATVAIEDRNFYNHIGIDLRGIARATYVTLTGGAVQGGSTLTQQLIKQVYFSEEAGDRTMTGIPRKIKEMILAIEVEKMYDKEQIITMYLNQSPYGGRRNGVESAARTYFDKGAKDLDLPESALLAAIPNNPSLYNPYNELGNEALLTRWQKVLRVMCEMGYISEQERDDALAVDILARVQPLANQYTDMKAPWFVLEVKQQLEDKYGVKTMREGGFTITTTLDYRAQKIAEAAVKAGSKYFYTNKSDNAALVSVDVETAQVIAMVGSVDWNKAGYGQVNATTSILEPASSIKPILDYTPLFTQRDGINYGAGSILRDENIDRIYCAGNRGSCRLRNASGKFYGNVTIRQALAGSLNIPAVKALYINGIDESLEIAHNLGDWSYCTTNNTYAGLSSAIGGGCGVKPVEHANAYASLARGGVYKDLAYVLEVKNSNGDVIENWQDSEGTRVVDEQVAYMTTSILSDPEARRYTFGSLAYDKGFYSKKVWYAAKTGTTDNGSGYAKDSWLLSYSPVLATAIWNGKHNGGGLPSGSHTVAFTISANYMEKVHEQVYGADGKWHSGMKIEQPSGMKKMTINGKTDIWPSWFTKKKAIGETETIEFDSVTKKLATECTPDETRVSIEVSKLVDPMTGSEVFYSSGYDTKNSDNLHQCSDLRPSANISYTTSVDPATGETIYTITGAASAGSHALSSYSLSVNGSNVKSGALSGAGGSISYDSSEAPSSIQFIVKDVAGYAYTATR